MLNIEEIKARERAATPGPWNVKQNCAGSFVTHGVNQNESYFVWLCSRTELPDDFAFIAHARTDIPELIAEVERLTLEKAEETAIKEFNYEMCNQKDLEIATLKKALEIASSEVNTAFKTLADHHVITWERKGSNAENINAWIKRAEQAQEQEDTHET